MTVYTDILFWKTEKQWGGQRERTTVSDRIGPTYNQLRNGPISSSQSIRTITNQVGKLFLWVISTLNVKKYKLMIRNLNLIIEKKLADETLNLHKTILNVDIPSSAASIDTRNRLLRLKSIILHSQTKVFLFL